MVCSPIKAVHREQQAPENDTPQRHTKQKQSIHSGSFPPRLDLDMQTTGTSIQSRQRHPSRQMPAELTHATPPHLITRHGHSPELMRAMPCDQPAESLNESRRQTKSG